MAKDNQIRMPSSGAGITQYFDDVKSKIQFKPISVVILIVMVIFLIFALYTFGGGLLV